MTKSKSCSKKSCSKKKGGPCNLRITKRVTNTKRHTLGYQIGGKFHSVARTRQLAAQGRVAGVQVVGNHVQAKAGRKRLSDLPTELRK